MRCAQPDAALEAAAARLIAAGAAGTVVRGGPNSQPRIDPLRIPFEAVPLSEVDPRFQELLLHESAGDAGAVSRNSSDSSRADHSSTPLLRSALSRNVRLKGGWILVASLALFVAIHALKAWNQQRISFQLVALSLALVTILVVPATGSWMTRTEYYLLPGGLLRRQARWGQSGWTLHVFERGRSVLLVFPNWGRQWRATIADGASRASWIGTQHEMTLLLRAWLSSVTPPTTEQLTDLH